MEANQALPIVDYITSSLLEGKDSLFWWPSDDKRKSEGPRSEKLVMLVDQLERLAKISQDIMESHGISSIFNNLHAVSRSAFRYFS